MAHEDDFRPRRSKVLDAGCYIGDIVLKGARAPTCRAMSMSSTLPDSSTFVGRADQHFGQTPSSGQSVGYLPGILHGTEALVQPADEEDDVIALIASSMFEGDKRHLVIRETVLVDVQLPVDGARHVQVRSKR
jgi:hypothetical protein